MSDDKNLKNQKVITLLVTLLVFVLILFLVIGWVIFTKNNESTDVSDSGKEVKSSEKFVYQEDGEKETMVEKEEEEVVSSKEVDAYINVLYGDGKKLKDKDKYATETFFLDNEQLQKYFILRDIDNDGIKELYISDSQTSETYWWCMFDCVNGEVTIPLRYEHDTTVQTSALLSNNMIYKYAHSGLSSEAIYPGAYSSDEFSGINNSYCLYSLNSNGLIQDELEMFWQSDVMKEDTAMPNLYYIQGKAVSLDEWEVTLNQQIVSKEIKAEEYSVLSEENLGANKVEGTVVKAETPKIEVESETSDIESEVQSIRDIYYSIQENINSYTVQDGGAGTTRYIDSKGYIRKIAAPKGAYNTELGEALLHYSAEYYYDGISQLVFVFVYEGDEEYRYYLKEGKCIRYIDEEGVITDYPDGAMYGEIADTDCFINAGMCEINWSNH